VSSRDHSRTVWSAEAEARIRGDVGEMARSMISYIGSVRWDSKHIWMPLDSHIAMTN
jgi:hypothetical protein